MSNALVFDKHEGEDHFLFNLLDKQKIDFTVVSSISDFRQSIKEASFNLLFLDDLYKYNDTRVACRELLKSIKDSVIIIDMMSLNSKGSEMSYSSLYSDKRFYRNGKKLETYIKALNNKI